MKSFRFLYNLYYEPGAWDVFLNFMFYEKNLLTRAEIKSAESLHLDACLMSFSVAQMLALTPLYCKLYNLPLYPPLYIILNFPKFYERHMRGTFKASMVYKTLLPAYLMTYAFTSTELEVQPERSRWIYTGLLFFLHLPVMRMVAAQEAIGSTTPLHRAVYKRDKTKFERLLDAGANIHAVVDGISLHELVSAYPSAINLSDYGYVASTDSKQQHPIPKCLTQIEQQLLNVLVPLSTQLQKFTRNNSKQIYSHELYKLIVENKVNEVKNALESLHEPLNLDSCLRVYELANSLQMLDVLLRHGVDFRPYLARIYGVDGSRTQLQQIDLRKSALFYLLPGFSKEQAAFFNAHISGEDKKCSISQDACLQPVKFEAHTFDLNQLMIWFASSYSAKNSLINPMTNLPAKLKKLTCNYELMVEMEHIITKHQQVFGDLPAKNLICHKEQFTLINQDLFERLYILDDLLRTTFFIVSFCCITLEFIYQYLASENERNEDIFVAANYETVILSALLFSLFLQTLKYIANISQPPIYKDLYTYQAHTQDFFMELKANHNNTPLLFSSYWQDVFKEPNDSDTEIIKSPRNRVYKPRLNPQANF